ncbi:MAG: hypothetical protein V4737_14125, partial [Curtobacterium sp.]
MSDDTSNAALQAMIDRAGRITADEAETLDTTWKADEGILLPEPSASLAIQGGADGRMVTNADLIAAWQHALEAAGAAGRVEEIEAAQEAGRAVRHSDARLRDRAGAEEAVRSAVLATGVRDLVSDDAGGGQDDTGNDRGDGPEVRLLPAPEPRLELGHALVDVPDEVDRRVPSAERPLECVVVQDRAGTGCTVRAEGTTDPPADDGVARQRHQQPHRLAVDHRGGRVEVLAARRPALQTGAEVGGVGRRDPTAAVGLLEELGQERRDLARECGPDLHTPPHPGTQVVPGVALHPGRERLRGGTDQVHRDRAVGVPLAPRLGQRTLGVARRPWPELEPDQGVAVADLPAPERPQRGHEEGVGHERPDVGERGLDGPRHQG